MDTQPFHVGWPAAPDSLVSKDLEDGLRALDTMQEAVVMAVPEMGMDLHWEKKGAIDLPPGSETPTDMKEEGPGHVQAEEGGGEGGQECEREVKDGDCSAEAAKDNGTTPDGEEEAAKDDGRCEEGASEKEPEHEDSGPQVSEAREENGCEVKDDEALPDVGQAQRLEMMEKPEETPVEEPNKEEKEKEAGA